MPRLVQSQTRDEADRPSIILVPHRQPMHFHIIASIHAAAGRENAVERALVALLTPSRAEAGCLAMDAFRSIDDERLFHIHSQWQDETAFRRHTQLPHALAFMEAVTPLTDRPIEAIRTRLLTT